MTTHAKTLEALRFRKRPVVIEAWQWRPHAPATEPPQWFFDACERRELIPEHDDSLTVTTLEDGKGRAKHVASPGDWIIRGANGELYHCKPDIFERTYEPAALAEAAPAPQHKQEA